MSVGLINPDVAAAGGRIARAVMEGGAGGWSTLIGRDVSYAIAGQDYGRPGEVVKDAGETVVTPVRWSGATRGLLYLLVPADGAREIVAHMMALLVGGDADAAATGLDAAGMDAYNEAATAFVGQGEVRIRGELGGAVTLTPEESRLVDLAAGSPSPAIADGEYLAETVKVTVEGRPPFTVTLLIGRSVTGVAADSDGPQAEERAEVARQLGVDPANLAIAMKIRLPLVVTIAAKKMRMELIQDMCPGTIIEFRKMSGENLDVMAANVKIATAEAVIVNQCFGVQIRNVVDPQITQE
ncbi:MAG: FliM/FliN family flagellar motor switch protein [Planctomycetes bacterium]|nr:FliM/FliN family flagellar motor switch protein [Planctomycetota bacterium]